MSLKNSIAKVFSMFGIGIYRINGKEKNNVDAQTKSLATWKDFEIESPLKHNTPGRMNEFFADQRMIQQYLGPERIKFYDEIVELAKQRKINIDNKDLVDVGCGTGHLLKKFKKHFAPKSITGMDFSEVALKIARQNLEDGKFFIHDLYKSSDKKFDVILCTEVLEHLQEPETALLNLLEMMNKESTCIITVPNGRMDFYEGHINFWSPESWEIFIRKNCKSYSVDTGMLSDNKNNYAIIRN